MSLATPRAPTPRAATPRSAATPRAATAPQQVAPGSRGRAATPMQSAMSVEGSSVKPEQPAKEGDGGVINHRLAQDATYGRRGRQAREQLKDAERVYDPVAESTWEKKYKFFSEMKMKGTYRTYARARHDPFNKDPTWGKSVLKNVAGYCSGNGITLKEVFQSVNVEGSAMSRPEIKKALVKVLPSLSDQELTAIFDVLDEDHSGEVSLAEFEEAMENGRTAKISKEAIERHRNPIHRIKRFPPANIEGWDHLNDAEAVQGTRYERVGVKESLSEMCQKETTETLGRISTSLASTPRALKHEHNIPKYMYFGGGADTNRFRRADHQRLLRSTGGESSSEPLDVTPRADLPDPGGLDLRPGFLCDLQSRKAFALTGGFPSHTPRSK